MSGLPIYIDIDGTLTDHPQQGGHPIESRLDRVRQLCRSGVSIVLWSGGGEEYVRRFAMKHGLVVYAMLGKPRLCVDDNPKIRPFFEVYSPEWLDS